jgi:hypothetical protein
MPMTRTTMPLFVGKQASQRHARRMTRSKRPTPKPGSSLIIAVTADDDRYAPCRHVAMDLAIRDGARLLLYDWDAAAVLGDPLPSDWSADGTKERTPDDLEPRDLETAGRAPIARQLEEALARGVDAVAWLPSKPGAGALAEYARDRGASTIVVPPDLQPAGALEQMAEGDAEPLGTMNRAASARIVVAETPSQEKQDGP